MINLFRFLHSSRWLRLRYHVLRSLQSFISLAACRWLPAAVAVVFLGALLVLPALYIAQGGIH